jgi:hypothetical protein
MGLGELYEHFVFIVTARSWKSIRKGLDRSVIDENEVYARLKTCKLAQFRDKRFENLLQKFCLKSIKWLLKCLIQCL